MTTPCITTVQHCSGKWTHFSIIHAPVHVPMSTWVWVTITRVHVCEHHHSHATEPLVLSCVFTLTLTDGVYWAWPCATSAPGTLALSPGLWGTRAGPHCFIPGLPWGTIRLPHPHYWALFSGMIPQRSAKTEQRTQTGINSIWSSLEGPEM